MRVDIVAAPSPGRAVAALHAGLRRCGIDARLTAPDSAVADVVAVWGARPARALARPGRHVLVLERGFAGDRGVWVACGWDGLAGRGRYAAVDDAGERWRAHFDGMVRAPRPDAGLALILGQVPGDAAVDGVDLPGWYRAARDRMQAAGFDVGFRKHPATPVDDGPPGCWRDHSRTIAEALAPVSRAVAWNSNGLTDAVLSGLTVVAGDAGAMTWPLAQHGLTAPPPDWFGETFDEARRAWCARLAWCQFGLGELECGDAWMAVRDAMAGGGWSPADG